MRKVKGVIVALLFFVIIILSVLTPTVFGVFIKEFEGRKYTLRGNTADELYAFKVKLIIETEDDGTLRTNKHYRVYVRVSITFINYNYLKSLRYGNVTLGWPITFNVVFSDSPEFFDVYYPGFDYYGAYFSVVPEKEGRYLLDLPIKMDIAFVDKDAITYKDVWRAGEPIWITVKSENEFALHLTIGTLILVIAAVSLLAGIKIGEKLTKKKMRKE